MRKGNKSLGCGDRRNPTSKRTKYLNIPVAICRNCNGTGKIEYYADKDYREENPIIETCKLCNGTGRVTLQGKQVVNIKPFEL